MTRPSVLFPLFCLAAAGACESAFSISSDGIIHVLVTSSGAGSDSDGFTLTVDGGDPRPVSSGATVTLDGLAQGTHTVLLSGIATNCAVDGDNPRSVLVGPEGGASVSFTVACEAVPSRTTKIHHGGHGDDTEVARTAGSAPDMPEVG
jgi:hypothetical protein